MTDLYWALYSGCYLLATIALLWIAKKFLDLCTPYSLSEQLHEKDNPAVGVVLSGYLLSITIVLCSLLKGDGTEVPSVASFLYEFEEILLFGVVAILLLSVANFLNDKIILRKFSNHQEIQNRNNTAVAAVVAGGGIASGLIIAGGISSAHTLLCLAISFVISQITLIAFSLIYERFTPHDDQQQIGEERNLAAGLGFAGNLIAFGLIQMKALSSSLNFSEEWSVTDGLVNIAYYTITGVVLLCLARLVTDKIFLRKVSITKEIVEDRNINVGLLEGTLAMSMGAILVFCL